MRQKLELVDAASKKSLTDDARKLLAAAGCKDIETSAEASSLIDSLYSSSNPEFTPGGRRTMRLLTSADIEKMI